MTEECGHLDNSTPGYDAFRSRDDLEAYGNNALLLFVAQLRLGFDDIDSFASNSLTDHYNDKKCDLVAVTSDKQRIILAQGYMSEKSRLAAPANKASELNTGVSWLLSGELDQLPDALRGAAAEVRDALEGGDVVELQLWFVHNCPESDNVATELAQAAHTADSLIKQKYPTLTVDVSAIEIGSNRLEEEYAKIQSPILVSDTHEFDIPGGYELTSDAWSTFCTAVSVPDLQELWSAHGTKLMSPNIRDYLGIVRSSGNINYGIKQTVKKQPRNFAIFNNGITVLVNGYELLNPNRLRVEGIGIVNGGQTTGALGSLRPGEAPDAADAKVMTRFVKCTSSSVLGDIVRYNNTQNKIEATDFRSGDSIQERLRKEFEEIPDAEYRGGRRGGATDAIQRSKFLLADTSVAQALAAFHGEPNLAYNETRSIWDHDAVYSKVFRDSVSARHIVYAFSLLKAIEKAKKRLLALPEDQRTEPQKRHIAFFSARGSNYVLMAALGYTIETILSRAIADRYDLCFGDNIGPADASELWQPVVDIALSFSGQLASATDQGLKSQERVKNALGDFSSLLEATRTAHAEPFDALASATIVLGA